MYGIFLYCNVCSTFLSLFPTHLTIKYDIKKEKKKIKTNKCTENLYIDIFSTCFFIFFHSK